MGFVNVYKRTLLLSAMALGIVACSREELPYVGDNDGQVLEQGLTMTINASISSSESTKTSLSGNDADGYKVLWSEGDQIIIGGETFTLDGGAGTTRGTFTGNLLKDGTYNAYYGTSDGEIPMTQTYEAGKITNSPMHAQITVTDGKAGAATFKNIGGLLHLTVSKVRPMTVTAITFQGRTSKSDNRYILECGSDGVAISENGTDFYIALPAGTYTNVVIELATDKGTLTKTLSTDKSITIKCSQITNVSLKTNSLNGHEFVDLGLPSGLLWATCNVGAKTPEGYGSYFSWGEVTGNKDGYSWSDYSWSEGSYNTLTKYNSYEGYGEVDNLTALLSDDDAASANWGDGWRMPTDEEMAELLYNCYWYYERDYKGSEVQGFIVYKVEDKNKADRGKITNSKGSASGDIVGTYSVSDTHIFLPFAGEYIYDEPEKSTELYKPDVEAYYWSSSLKTDQNPNKAVSLFLRDFGDGDIRLYLESRNNGLSIRPVCK